MRKIIQIALCDDTMLWALCDDGSVWYQSWDKKEATTKWIREDDIPQDEQPE